jgi:predicted helicase
VKNSDAKAHGQIYWHDIGDYLSREEKLEKVSGFASIGGIADANGWQIIEPDQHGDWLKQRDDSFNQFILMGNKKGEAEKLFDNFSLGVATGRDVWCYNPSMKAVASNMQRMIGFYNGEVQRFNKAHGGLDKKAREEKVDLFIDTNPGKISWTRALKNDLAKNKQFSFEKECLTPSLYRPFTKMWMYFNRQFNEMVYQMPRIFPNAAAQNLVICVSGMGFKDGVSALISNAVPDLQIQFNGQCFPLYLYESAEETDKIDFEGTGDLFATKSNKPAASKGGYTRRDAITDEGLKHFKDAYPGEKIKKEDIFYYVYGLLHSPDYRDRYADNLSKELPRIPCVKKAADFWHFSKAGRDLAELHLNYETVKPYPVKLDTGKRAIKSLNDEDYRVEKMKFAAKGDKTTVIYNHHITIREIPEGAFDYVVNGKAALDWVMERQCVKTDKDSGIVNDANDWAIDTMGNAKYPLELFMRVITVSLETMKIVRALPKLDI